MEYGKYGILIFGIQGLDPYLDKVRSLDHLRIQSDGNNPAQAWELGKPPTAACKAMSGRVC